MTPRSFWMILIRIIGLYIILDSLSAIVPFLSNMYYAGHQTGADLLVSVAGFVLIISLYFLLFWYLVFRTETVIDKFQLDKGFTEEKLEINIHRSTILKIAVIVIGGLLFIDSLPILFKEIFMYFQLSRPDSGFKENPTSGWIIYYLVKSSIGIYMMTNNRTVVNFIERKRRDSTVTQESTD